MTSVTIAEDAPPADGFRDSVRRALAHLYDAEVLANHPLVYRLALEKRADRARSLRQYLIELIQSLKPDLDEPAESPRWQIYQVLLQRYVRGIGAEALADQLSISSRQLRRLQVEAIAQLSDALLERLAEAVEPVRSAAGAAGSGDHESQAEQSAIDDELGWLCATPLEAINVVTILDEVSQMIQPLVDHSGGQLLSHIPADLPEAIADATGMKQVLLSLVTYGMACAGNTSLTLAATCDAEHVVVSVATEARVEAQESLNPAARLRLARRILGIFGGELSELQGPGDHLEVQIRLARAGAIPVLVIDDNPDVRALYEHYVAGTRYCILTCQEPRRALEQAVSLQPRLIVVDIMMPRLDGWALLGRLRHHPDTASIPTVVCTIVPEADLALSLGAAGFLQKPVTRSAFLAALDRQMITASPGSD